MQHTLYAMFAPKRHKDLPTSFHVSLFLSKYEVLKTMLVCFLFQSQHKKRQFSSNAFLIFYNMLFPNSSKLSVCRKLSRNQPIGLCTWA